MRPSADVSPSLAGRSVRFIAFLFAGSGRLHVDVHAEKIVGVVLLLELGQPLIVGAVGLALAPRLDIEHVYVNTVRRLRRNLPDSIHPFNRFARLGALPVGLGPEGEAGSALMVGVEVDRMAADGAVQMRKPEIGSLRRRLGRNRIDQFIGNCRQKSRPLIAGPSRPHWKSRGGLAVEV